MWRPAFLLLVGVFTLMTLPSSTHGISCWVCNSKLDKDCHMIETLKKHSDKWLIDCDATDAKGRNKFLTMVYGDSVDENGPIGLIGLFAQTITLPAAGALTGWVSKFTAPPVYHANIPDNGSMKYVLKTSPVMKHLWVGNNTNRLMRAGNYDICRIILISPPATQIYEDVVAPGKNESDRKEVGDAKGAGTTFTIRLCGHSHDEKSDHNMKYKDAKKMMCKEVKSLRGVTEYCHCNNTNPQGEYGGCNDLSGISRLLPTPLAIFAFTFVVGSFSFRKTF